MRGSPGKYMTASPIATQGMVCMDDVTAEHCFYSQATWVADVLGLSYRHVIRGCFVQPSTGRRSLD